MTIETGKLNINPRYLSALNLIEVWLIVWLILICILINKFGVVALPVSLATSSTAVLALCLGLAILMSFIVPPSYKDLLTLPLIQTGLLHYIDISFEGVFEMYSELKPNTVIVMNYPANFLEYLIIPAFILKKYSKRVAIVAGKNAAGWAKYFLGPDSVISLGKQNNFDKLPDQLLDCIKNNRIPILFPERDFMSRSNIDEICEFKTGFFKHEKCKQFNVLVAYTQHIKHFCGFSMQKELRLLGQYLDSSEVDSVKARDVMLKLKEQVTPMVEELIKPVF